MPSEATDLLSLDKMCNMVPSAYFYRSPSKITHFGNRDLQHHIYVQVARSTPWTVFLARMDSLNKRMVFGCSGCATNARLCTWDERAYKSQTLIGCQ